MSSTFIFYVYGLSRLEVSEAAIKVLEEEKRPVTVVAVIGPSRTGKSFLLNQIIKRIAGEKQGRLKKKVWITSHFDTAPVCGVYGNFVTGEL